MTIRPVTDADHPVWAAMRSKLWPDADPRELEGELASLFALDPPYTVYIAEEAGRQIGFIELWVRSYAEGGPPEPSAYVEGLWVDPEKRRTGVATALLRQAEKWAKDKGFKWLGSDADLDNRDSHAWHKAAGFTAIEQLVVFGKPLK
ncbi:MAG TPA: GNAT family N-acetyltransferase [Sphingomicrobium sp.]|nr:GNAT family N-acetyltransferase [Sphingomicrobium sp.]